MSRLLFALLASLVLVSLQAHPSKATFDSNGLEFGMPFCPSFTTIDRYNSVLFGATGAYAQTAYATTSMQFIVPTVYPTPINDDRAAGIWTGFTDGGPQEQIIQAGIYVQSLNNQPSYVAWWELHTLSSYNTVTLPNAVVPGDTITVKITRKDTTNTNWQIDMTETHQGQTSWSFTHPVSGFLDAGSPQYSEEIISNQTPHPDPNYIMAPQTNSYQVVYTNYTVFGNSTPQANTWQAGDCAHDNNVVQAYTSVPNSSGGFTVYNAPSAPPYPATDYGPGVGCCFSFQSYSSGSWAEDFGAGGESSQSIVTAMGGGQTTASAAWHAQLAAYYSYQVLAFVPPHPGHALGWAHYYFTDNNHAYTQVGVNQAGNYGKWLNLGNWEADGNGHIVVQLHNDVNQPGYYLEADAMRFIPVPTSYPLNTYGPGSGCCFSTTGTWYSGAGHGLIGQEIWAWSNGTTGSATADWNPKLNQGAVYDVQVYIPNYAANGYVHYYITDDGGTTMVSVNQANFSNVWVDLGDFTANSSTGFIDVSLHNDDDGYHTNYVGADAMKFIPVKSCHPACTPVPGPGTVIIGG